MVAAHDYSVHFGSFAVHGSLRYAVTHGSVLHARTFLYRLVGSLRLRGLGWMPAAPVRTRTAMRLCTPHSFCASSFFALHHARTRQFASRCAAVAFGSYLGRSVAAFCTLVAPRTAVCTRTHALHASGLHIVRSLVLPVRLRLFAAHLPAHADIFCILDRINYLMRFTLRTTHRRSCGIVYGSVLGSVPHFAFSSGSLGLFLSFLRTFALDLVCVARLVTPRSGLFPVAHRLPFAVVLV